jgi:ferric-dicitrate binding protein FerR (iron transport regulator)
MSGRGNTKDHKHKRGDDLTGMAKDLTSGYRVPARRTREEAWALLEEKIGRSPGETKNRRTLLPRFSFPAAAALLLLLAAGSWLLLSTVTVNVPAGEKKDLTLPDGSLVTLNAGTQLTRHRLFINRRVRLKGEGYFQVKRGSGFRVVCPNGTVTVKGTRFNVLSRRNVLDVTCYAGRVEVTPKENKEGVLLKKGEGIRFAAGKETRYNTGKDEPVPPWKSGVFRFRNVPLQDVLEELERQFNIRIEYYGPAGRYYTGSFRSDPLYRALKMICLPMILCIPREVPSNSPLTRS